MENCEKMEKYGEHKNLDDSPQPDDKVCLDKIGLYLALCRIDEHKVNVMLNEFYGGERGDD